MLPCLTEFKTGFLGQGCRARGEGVIPKPYTLADCMPAGPRLLARLRNLTVIEMYGAASLRCCRITVEEHTTDAKPVSIPHLKNHPKCWACWRAPSATRGTSQRRPRPPAASPPRRAAGTWARLSAPSVKACFSPPPPPPQSLQIQELFLLSLVSHRILTKTSAY